MSSPTTPSARGVNPISVAVPSFYAQAGNWFGTYRYYDPVGQLLESKESRVELSFPDDLPGICRQRLTTTLADGRTEVANVEGQLQGDRMRWSMPTMTAEGWDGGRGLFLLYVERHDLPGVTFSELITLSGDRNTRTRTLHWYRDGLFFRRTLVDERRVD